MGVSKKGYGVKNPPPKKGAWSKKIKETVNKRIHKHPTTPRGR